MSRLVLLIPVAPLVGLPILTLPSPYLAGLAGLAGLVCAVGVLGRWVTITAAGTMTAVGAYALALWITAAPPDTLGALVFGLSLFIVLDGTAVARRFQGAAVHPSAVRSHVRHWVRIGALAAVAVVVLDVVARALVFVAPSPVHASLAGLGALAVVLGVARLLWSPRGGPARTSR